MLSRLPFALALVPFLLAASPAVRADEPPPGPPPRGPMGGATAPRAPGPLTGPVEGSDTPAGKRTLIGWYGTLAGARAEAARSGRPVLLLSAAPQCHGICGVW